MLSYWKVFLDCVMLGYSWRGGFRGCGCLMVIVGLLWLGFFVKCHNLMSNFFEKRIVILIDMNAPVSSSASGVPAR